VSPSETTGRSVSGSTSRSNASPWKAVRSEAGRLCLVETLLKLRRDVLGLDDRPRGDQAHPPEAVFRGVKARLRGSQDRRELARAEESLVRDALRGTCLPRGSRWVD